MESKNVSKIKLFAQIYTFIALLIVGFFLNANREVRDLYILQFTVEAIVFYSVLVNAKILQVMSLILVFIFQLYLIALFLIWPFSISDKMENYCDLRVLLMLNLVLLILLNFKNALLISFHWILSNSHENNSTSPTRRENNRTITICASRAPIGRFGHLLKNPTKTATVTPIV